MSRKPLIIASHDPEFKALKENLDKGHEMFEEAMSFLKKQAEDNHKKFVGTHWNAIRDALKNRELLPDDYSDDKYSLEFDDGVLYLKPRSDKLARSILDLLFNK